MHVPTYLNLLYHSHWQSFHVIFAYVPISDAFSNIFYVTMCISKYIAPIVGWLVMNESQRTWKNLRIELPPRSLLACQDKKRKYPYHHNLYHDLCLLISKPSEEKSESLQLKQLYIYNTGASNSVVKSTKNNKCDREGRSP
jgi:hypothetical protein